MKRYVSIWIVLGGIFAVSLVGFTLVLHGGYWLHFANVSERYFYLDWSKEYAGYDGQYAYFIARDPMWAIAHLDSPSYRFQRILYPLLARLLALGQPDWLPFTMVLVNIFAVAFGTGAFAALLYRENAPKWAPVLFFAWFGVAQALLWDLTELIALVFSLWALVFLVRGQTLGSGALFGLGALGKEITFLFAAPVIGGLVAKRQWKQAFQMAVLTFVPYIVWMLVLRLWLGIWTLEQAELTGFTGVCTDDPTIPFMILFVFIPALILLIGARRHWGDAYFLMTLANVGFFVILLARSHCGPAVFRWGSAMVLAEALLLAKLDREGWLRIAILIWSATIIVTLAVAMYYPGGMDNVPK